MLRTLLLIFLMFFLLAFSGAVRAGRGLAPRVLSWGRNPDTGQVVLVLSFGPEEWRRFEALCGRPRAGRSLPLSRCLGYQK